MELMGLEGVSRGKEDWEEDEGSRDLKYVRESKSISEPPQALSNANLEPPKVFDQENRKSLSANKSAEPEVVANEKVAVKSEVVATPESRPLSAEPSRPASAASSGTRSVTSSIAQLPTLRTAFLPVINPFFGASIFEPRADGIDIYIDGIRFPPAALMSSRVRIRAVAPGTQEGVLPVSAFLTELDSPSESFHRIAAKLEIRDTSKLTDPTTQLLFRFDGLSSAGPSQSVALDQGSVQTFGFAQLPLFRGSDGSYNLKSWDAGYCVNEGCWQIPINPRLPPGLQAVIPDALVNQPRLPLTTLLVRLRKAPKNEALRVLSRADFPPEDWLSTGVDQPMPEYESGAYDSSRVGELDLGERSLAHRWERTTPPSGSAELQGKSQRSVEEALRNFRRLKGLEAMEDQSTWHRSRYDLYSPDSLPAPSLDLGRSLGFEPSEGFFLSVDRVHKPKALDGVLTVITSIAPPAGLYIGPKSVRDAFASVEWDLEQPMKSQGFKESWLPIREVTYSKSVCAIFEIKIVDVTNKKTPVQTVGWTMFPVFDPLFNGVKCGVYQLPIVLGEVNADIVAQVAMGASDVVANPWMVIDTWVKKDKDGKIPKRDPEMSLIVKVRDRRISPDLINRETPIYYGQAMPKGMAYDPADFLNGKKLIKMLPRGMTAEEWMKQMRVAIANATGLAKYANN